MKIESRKASELIPYEKNTKKHDSKQIKNVAESIKQYGFVQPLVIDKNNVVVIGHCRLMAAKRLKLKEVPCVCVDDLTSEQVNALRIVDNKSNESEWDFDFLAEELPEIDLSMFDFDFGLPEEKEEDNPYTMNVDAPIYQIKGEMPTLEECVDNTKALELIEKINKSEVSEELKAFLTLAAYRHLKFNYSKIAEYYAHADKETQALFEESALVIIDFNSAIRNGFTKLSKRIEEMQDGED